MDNLVEAPEHLSALATLIWAWSETFLPRFASALLLVVVGIVVGGWLSRLVERALHRNRHVDDTIVPVAGAVVRYAILILVLVAALGQIGIHTASLLAVLGAAGLAIGLALQGTLQNIAAGIMLLYLRPFRVGDYIQSAAATGTVKSVGLFATELETFDGLYVFTPNSQIWNQTLQNQTRNPRRLMSIQIGIGYGDDAAEARRVLLNLAASEPRILKEPAPYVYVDNYGDSSVVVTFRAWAPTSIFWDTQRTVIEEAKRRLDAAGIEIPFPQRIVHVMAPGGEKDAKAFAAAAGN